MISSFLKMCSHTHTKVTYAHGRWASGNKAQSNQFFFEAIITPLRDVKSAYVRLLKVR